MEKLPECLKAKYELYKQLVDELTGPEEECVCGTSTAETHKQPMPEKLLCNIWKILEENPDYNVSAALEARTQDTPPQPAAGAVMQVKVETEQSFTDGSTHVCRAVLAWRARGCGVTQNDISCMQRQIEDLTEERKKMDYLKQEQEVMFAAAIKHIKRELMDKSEAFTKLDQDFDEKINELEAAAQMKGEAPPSDIDAALYKINEIQCMDRKCINKLRALISMELALRCHVRCLEERDRIYLESLLRLDDLWAEMEIDNQDLLKTEVEMKVYVAQKLQICQSSLLKWKDYYKNLSNTIRDQPKEERRLKEEKTLLTCEVNCLRLEKTNIDKKLGYLNCELEKLKKDLQKLKIESEHSRKCTQRKVCETKCRLDAERQAIKEDDHRMKVKLKDHRNDLAIACKYLLDLNLANEDLKAEDFNLSSEIDIMKDTMRSCKIKCATRERKIAEEIAEQSKLLDAVLDGSVKVNLSDVATSKVQTEARNMNRGCVAVDVEIEDEINSCVAAKLRVLKAVTNCAEDIVSDAVITNSASVVREIEDCIKDGKGGLSNDVKTEIRKCINEAFDEKLCAIAKCAAKNVNNELTEDMRKRISIMRCAHAESCCPCAVKTKYKNKQTKGTEKSEDYKAPCSYCDSEIEDENISNIAETCRNILRSHSKTESLSDDINNLIDNFTSTIFTKMKKEKEDEKRLKKQQKNEIFPDCCASMFGPGSKQGKETENYLKVETSSLNEDQDYSNDKSKSQKLRTVCEINKCGFNGGTLSQNECSKSRQSLIKSKFEATVPLQSRCKSENLTDADSSRPGSRRESIKIKGRKSTSDIDSRKHNLQQLCSKHASLMRSKYGVSAAGSESLKSGTSSKRALEKFEQSKYRSDSETSYSDTYSKTESVKRKGSLKSPKGPSSCKTCNRAKSDVSKDTKSSIKYKESTDYMSEETASASDYARRSVKSEGESETSLLECSGKRSLKSRKSSKQAAESGSDLCRCFKNKTNKSSNELYAIGSMKGITKICACQKDISENIPPDTIYTIPAKCLNKMFKKYKHSITKPQDSRRSKPGKDVGQILDKEEKARNCQCPKTDTNNKQPGKSSTCTCSKIKANGSNILENNFPSPDITNILNPSNNCNQSDIKMDSFYESCVYQLPSFLRNFEINYCEIKLDRASVYNTNLSSQKKDYKIPGNNYTLKANVSKLISEIWEYDSQIPSTIDGYLPKTCKSKKQTKNVKKIVDSKKKK